MKVCVTGLKARAPSWAPVSKAYRPVFTFNGTIDSVESSWMQQAECRRHEDLGRGWKRTSRWNQLNQNPANRAEHLSGAIRRCSKSPLFGNYGVIVSITPFSRIPVSTAKSRLIRNDPVSLSALAMMRQPSRMRDRAGCHPQTCAWAAGHR